MTLECDAAKNFDGLLKQNQYPGRGIVIGLNKPGTKFIQIYWIMGRSANSQNRIFVRQDELIKTAPFESKNISHPELIIYTAMRGFGRNHIVSNGDQTDTILDVLRAGGSWDLALAARTYEPDAPNFTPRIAGLLKFQPAKITLVP